MSTSQSAITVVKIGGSTLGADDTSLADIAEFQRLGGRPVVVHGGGAMITEWLGRMSIESEFVDGLRSTSAEALNVAMGVLRGVVNPRLVAEFSAMGVSAVGLCGIDGGSVRAERYDERLGFVGRITSVDAEIFHSLLNAGTIPVVAPIALEPPSQPVNINGDTMAGEIAHALRAERLVFLTDVDGLLDDRGELVEHLSGERAEQLRAAGVLTGGMIPKVEASMRAAEAGSISSIVNGTRPGTLQQLLAGKQRGTTVGAGS